MLHSGLIIVANVYSSHNGKNSGLKAPIMYTAV